MIKKDFNMALLNKKLVLLHPEKLNKKQIMTIEKSIVLNQGLGNLKFGMGIDEIVSLLGNPNEVETIGEDLEMPTTVLHYAELGLSLFFDYEMLYNKDLGMPWEQTTQFERPSDREILACIDIDAEDTVLFGEKVIGKSSQEIVKLMVSNGIIKQTMDKEVWGEERISFEDYAIDFFFVEDKLLSINFGK
ncbi:MAG: hypothetical protein LBO06_00245 [Bacteroidales bacterium]|jgi:hypothetical protein|nr:hypothetical protein [Bacteroidales bacterium]